MPTTHESAIAHRALTDLEQLRRGCDLETARDLFEVKDRIDRVAADRNDDDFSRKCSRAVLRLARAMALSPEDIREQMWIAARDAAQEWIWILE